MIPQRGYVYHLSGIPFTSQMYVNGDVGARSEGEAFGESYELPNARAYGESCAAIGNTM